MGSEWVVIVNDIGIPNHREEFMLAWFRDHALRRRVQAGLNKDEARNALARVVFIHRQGEIRDSKLEIRTIAPVG